MKEILYFKQPAFSVTDALLYNDCNRNAFRSESRLGFWSSSTGMLKSIKSFWRGFDDTFLDAKRTSLLCNAPQNHPYVFLLWCIMCEEMKT